MRCRLGRYVALGALLGAAACSNLRPEAPATPAAAPAAAAPTALAPPPAAPPAPPATPEARFAVLDPAEIHDITVELDLAYAADLCGFPVLGEFMREYLQQKIEACPNSPARKAALREVLAGTALHQKRRDDQARTQGDPPHCAQENKLTVIKELTMVAQSVIIAANKPLDCSHMDIAEPYKPAR
jgi:hypothetical protein